LIYDTILDFDFAFHVGYNVALSNMEVIIMAANAVVRARIDGRVKTEAEAVLASIGLTVSDAFRLMMMRIAREKKLPFEPLVPNKETIEAMQAARRGEFEWVGPADKLLEHLDADS
jgi:DNA-damage-inducible protein J